MRTYFNILFCFLLSVSSLAQSFDKAAFYATMQGGDSIKINQQTNLLERLSIKEKQAYIGTLLMKKAESITNKKQKLETFKSGKHKLEDALQKDSTNAEYHFLRLMIQEHAPKILGYHHDLQNDKICVVNGYKALSPIVRQAIVGYSKQSKILSELK